jgi:hypothetical protein
MENKVVSNTLNEDIQKEYYMNVTRFSNIRTFLALIRTCAVFVALAIYMKNRYVFVIVSIIILFGTLEFYLTNLKIKNVSLKASNDTYFNLVAFYAIIFLFIFGFLFINPPFKK